ncbi:MAG: outer membrane beta-barrel protein [Edaphobacter sp.]|nr:MULTISPECIES: outer membrane beta-barrel protein [Acidobacteriaceae]MDW5264894.1 outer membrane beta-barrel protein [Edaphobacter sp.]
MQTTISRSSKNHLSTLLLRTAALGVFTAAATLGLQAQQPAIAAAPAQPALNLQASLIAPLDLASSSSSSSSSDSDTAAPIESFDMSTAAALQPPPRRRYRRPNYTDSHTNPDGSNKYTFMVGGGFILPSGGTHNYASPGWKFQVGGGRNFNKTLGVLLQFDYDKLGIQTHTLNSQLALYNDLGAQDPTTGGSLTQLNGYIHDWSFSLDPIVNYYTSDTWGAYVTGGIGFYHKATVFTTPAIGEYCDPYYGCYTYQANQPIDTYNSNAFGVNGGFGFTYKLSRWSGTRLYGEARYVWTDNKPRPYDVSGQTSYFNAFPQASARTTYIPVTFGIRF